MRKIAEITRLQVLNILLSSNGYSDDRINAAIDALMGTTPSPGNDEPLMFKQNVCDILRISRETFQSINPPYYKVGKRRRYRLSEVLAYVHRPPV